MSHCCDLVVFLDTLKKVKLGGEALVELELEDLESSSTL